MLDGDKRGYSGCRTAAKDGWVVVFVFQGPKMAYLLLLPGIVSEEHDDVYQVVRFRDLEGCMPGLESTYVQCRSNDPHYISCWSCSEGYAVYAVT